MSAMNKAYDVDETRNFFVKNGLALLLTLIGSVGVIFAFVTIVGGSVASEQLVQQLGIPDDVWTTHLADPVPDRPRDGRHRRGGAVPLRAERRGLVPLDAGRRVRVRRRLGAATALFSIYVANFANYANTYGALGGVIVLMLWFYITALLLLVAAEVVVRPREGARAREARGPAGGHRPARRGKRRSAPARQPSAVPARRAHATQPEPAFRWRRRAHAGSGQASLPNAAPAAPSSSRRWSIAKEAAGAATGADARPRMSVGKRAGAFAMLGVAAVVGAIAGLLGGDDDKGATA